MTINENIRRIRLEKGLSQKEVAEACGTVGPTIRAYEAGKAKPKPVTVAKIAKALGVSVAELYGMPESMQMSTECDPETSAAIYQTLLIESGGQIDGADISQRRLLAAFSRLNNDGKKEAAKRLEELAQVPAFQLDRGRGIEFTEEEQTKILWAFASLKEAMLEKSLMEKSSTKSPAALSSNRKIIEDRTNTILKCVEAALERSKYAQSDK